MSTPGDEPRVNVAGIILLELHYALTPPFQAQDLQGEYAINIKFGFEVRELEMDNRLEVICTHKIRPDAANIRIVLVGKFTAPTKAALEEFGPNSAAILYPYARTYLATVTGWGPMNTILIPLANVTRDGMERAIQRNAELAKRQTQEKAP